MIEQISDQVFRQAVELLDRGDAKELRAHLLAHPTLVDQRVEFPDRTYFKNPALIEFVAENPVRNGTLPANIVEVTKVILDAGTKRSNGALNETLMLVSSGCVTRECRVQIPLIHLLCEYGADPNVAMIPALAHAEFEAVNALLGGGAKVDLPVAAATGRTEEVHDLLLTADRPSRHRALALAAQFGHVEIARMLLDAGEDPSRYNPAGLHAHSTPLHQAAFAGHRRMVELLVERGARVDLTDMVWQGTPAGWAKHGNHVEIERYLRTQEEQAKNPR